MDKQQPKYLEISPEDLEKIAVLRAKDDQKVKVDEEWLAIAEFGKHYGWDGIKAVLDNEIDPETFAVLLVAGRKIDFRNLLNDAQTAFVGSAAAQSKKPSKVFGDATKNWTKAMKADTQ